MAGLSSATHVHVPLTGKICVKLVISIHKKKESSEMRGGGNESSEMRSVTGMRGGKNESSEMKSVTHTTRKEALDENKYDFQEETETLCNTL